MRDLLAEVTAALDRGRPLVYCAVVETRGSTPQKPGAIMLVYPDGSQSGTLGGGCIEAEVRQQALRRLTDTGAVTEVLTFQLDDNYGWDDGLICGGRMAILADPLTGTHAAQVADYYRRRAELTQAGRGLTEAVALPGASVPASSRYLFDERGRLVAKLGPDGDVGSHVKPLADRPRPYVHQGISYLPTLPRITLLIVGGGHVGQAVARLGAEVDFAIWAMDDRDRYVSDERFPMASRRIVGPVGPTLQQLLPTLDSSIYALIVTRGHNHDEEALYHLALAPVGYLGMIGSKRKIRLIYEDLIAKGIPESALERVHAPLGFDIGSQTVPEIAVSIVAELIAVRNRGSTIAEARKNVFVRPSPS